MRQLIIKQNADDPDLLILKIVAIKMNGPMKLKSNIKQQQQQKK